MNQEKKAQAILVLLATPMLVLSVVIAMFPLGLLRAWVIQQLYKWFLLPLGLPALNIWQLWGIALIVTLLTLDIGRSKDPESKWWSGIVLGVLSSLVALLLGFVLKTLAA